MREVAAQRLSMVAGRFNARTLEAKAEATFSWPGCLVRRTLGANNDLGTSADADECILWLRATWEAGLDQLAVTA